MPENPTLQTEEFSKILTDSFSGSQVERDNIYQKLRITLSPQQIEEKLIEYILENGFPENEMGRGTIIKIFAMLEEELPHEETQSEDDRKRNRSPFYEKVGDIALNLSIAFLALDLVGIFIRNVNLGNDLINQLISLFFDHVGNAKYSLLMLLIFIGLELGNEIRSKSKITESTKRIYKKEIKSLVEYSKILFPYLLITILFLYQIDTETVQILPASFGTPDIGDLPVGLISIVGLAKGMEIQISRRSNDSE